MDSSSLLGSVSVEVKADLSKLVSDFAAARTQTNAFAGDVQRVVGPTNALSGSTANLAKQFDLVQRQYNPLIGVQEKYAKDLGVVAAAEQAGVVAGADAAVLRSTMAASFEDLTKKAEGSSEGLAGWAVSTEHHLRAMRLLLEFVGVTIAAKLGEFAIKTLESTAAIKEQAEALGLTTDQLQEYRAMAAQVGMSTADMDKALVTFGKNVQDLALGRVSTFSKMLDKMGVSYKDASGHVKSTNEILLGTIDGLQRVGDQTQRTGGQVVAFGEAGAKAGGLVKAGSEGVAQLSAAVKAMGLVLSEDQIRTADQTSQKLNTLWEVLKIKFADTVVENAQAIDTLATALVNFVSTGISNAVSAIGDFIQRIKDMLRELREVRDAINEFTDSYSIPSLLGHDAYGNSLTGQKPTVVHGLNQAGTTVVLQMDDTPSQPQKKGNVDLGGLLSPKGKKAKQPKFDEFTKEMDAELAEQLQLEHDATTDIVVQNTIEKEIIDKKTEEKEQEIKRQVKDKSLTAPEGKQLIAQLQINAAMEKVAADRKLEIAQLQEAKRFADEEAKLKDDSLALDKSLARTNEQRKAADRAILESKQEQAVSALQESIDEATTQKNGQRVLELTKELAELKANQLREWKQFDIDQMNAMQKFEYNLPQNQGEFKDTVQTQAFSEFNSKLQQAGQFANDLGGDFGKAAAALAQFQNPLSVLKGLLTDLASTFTKNFIEKPVSDWIAAKLGQPLAKQAFGGELDKLAKEAGGTALTTNQMNTALAQATGSLYALEHAAAAAASAIGGRAAASGQGGGMFDFGQSLETGSQGGTFSGSDLFGGPGSLDFASTLGSTTNASSNFDAIGNLGGSDIFAPLAGTGAGSIKSLGQGITTVDGGMTALTHALAGSTSGLGQFVNGLTSVLQTLASGSGGGGGGGGGLMSLLGGGGGAGGLGSLFGSGAGDIGAGSGMFDFGSTLGDVGGSAAFSDIGTLGTSGMFDFAFRRGGHTGYGADDEEAGIVHKNEYVWDAPTTRWALPMLHGIASSRVPSFNGPGAAGLAAKASPGQPVHVHFDGGIHLHGVEDERAARKSANQFMSEVHGRTARVVKKGLVN